MELNIQDNYEHALHRRRALRRNVYNCAKTLVYITLIFVAMVTPLALYIDHGIASASQERTEVKNIL